MGIKKKNKKPKVEKITKVKRKPTRKKRIKKVVPVDTQRFQRGGRQRIWLRCYLDETCKRTFNQATESAIMAGYNCKTRASFVQVGRRNRVKFEKEIVKYLDENHLSVAVLKKKMISLLEAKETKFFSYLGKVVSKRTVDALGIQTKTLEMAFRARGIGTYSSEAVTTETSTYKVVYTEPPKRAPELEPDYENLTFDEMKAIYNEKMRELKLIKNKVINNEGFEGQEPDEYGFYR